MASTLSIIIPVYNTALYLKRCLDSVFNEEITGIEVILIDDGSTDGSGSICDEFAKTHSNVQVRHIQNSGVSHARNLGLDIASGKYIWFVDSDDRILPGAFQLLSNTLKTCPEMIIFQEIEENGYGQQIGVLPAPTNTLYKDYGPLQCGDQMYSHDRIFLRVLAKGVRFDTRLRLLEDRDFLYKLCQKITGQVVIIDIPLYAYLMTRSDSAINSLPVDDFIAATEVEYSILLSELQMGRAHPAYEMYISFTLRTLAMICKTNTRRENFNGLRAQLLKFDRYSASLAGSVQAKYLLCKIMPKLYKVTYELWPRLRK